MAGETKAPTPKAPVRRAAPKRKPEPKPEPLVDVLAQDNGKADQPAEGEQYPPVGSIWTMKDGRATWPVIVCSTPVEVGPGFSPDAGKVHVQSFFGLTTRADQNVPVAHLRPVGGG